MTQKNIRNLIYIGLSTCLLLTFLLTNFINPKPTYACSLEPSYNYWYKMEYEFDQADLPPGLEFNVNYEYHPAEGRFNFLGTTSAKTYIGLESRRSEYQALKQGDVVDQKFIDSYASYGYASINDGETIDPQATLPLAQFNGESPFDKPATVPEKQTFDLVLFHDLEVYRIPITVTFSENIRYKSKLLSHPVNAQSINHSADVIFTGVAISVDNKTTNGYLYGPAEVTVGSWLKGEGPQKLTFGRYGDGADCAETIELNQPYIFFLNKTGDAYTGVPTNGYGITKLPYSQHNIDSITDIVGQEPVVFESTDSLLTRIAEAKVEDEKQILRDNITSVQLNIFSLRSSPLFWVSVSVIGLVLGMALIRNLGQKK